MGLYRSTLSGVLAPRRFVPFVLVAAPVLAAQWRLSRPSTSTVLGTSAPLMLGMLMTAAFVLCAPYLWRVCGPNGALWRRGLGLAVYTAAGFVVVFGIGFAIARWAGLRTSFMTARESLWIVLGMFWVGGWGLGRDIDNEQRLRDAQERADRAQLLAVRSHLDPHFLFNTLNAIAEWCREDGKVAEEAILQLSHLLREVLAGIKAPSWPLERELAIVRGVFALHRIRNPGAWELIDEVDPATLAHPVPPMVLLPLAENAMKHGPSAGHKGRVVLRTRREGGVLRVDIENPGAFKGPREGGEGLDLVRKRLEITYGAGASFEIRAHGDRTVATVIVRERAA